MFGVSIYGVFYAAAIQSALHRIRNDPEAHALGSDIREQELAGSWLVFCAFVGARALELASLTFLPGYDEPWNGFWSSESGLCFFGGVLGGIGGLKLWVWSRGLSFFRACDVCVKAMPVALGLGRLGNFWAGELFGRPTSGLLGCHFQRAEDGGRSARHPTQLYEALLEGPVLSYLLRWVARPRGQRPPGQLTYVFMMGYGTVRFLVEFWKEPDAPLTCLGTPLSIWQLCSLLMVCSGLGIGSIRKPVAVKVGGAKGGSEHEAIP